MFKLSTSGVLLLFGAFCCCAKVELPSDYEAKTAEAKLEILLKHIMNTEGSQGRYPNPFGYLRFLFQDDLSPTCDHFSDLTPYDHEKRIHSVGQVAAVRFESNGDHEYTGLFQGAPYSLVRLSLAAQPSEKAGTTPGLAVKFLRSGMPSANFVAMHSLDAQASGNFFEQEFTNHLSPVDNGIKQFIAAKFARVSSPPEAVGLSDIASYTVGGDKVDQPIFPFEIMLVPNVDLQKQFVNVPATEQGFEDIMLSIPADTELYDVFARATPSALKKVIGKMSISTKLMYSSFGDDDLFFRHQRMEDDFELRPEWKWDEEGRRGLRKRCPLGLDRLD